MNDEVAFFEPTHGTVPRFAGMDKVNPSSIILCAEMMLRHIGWFEAAELISEGLNGAIANKAVTYDFARLMPDATEVSCSEFGQLVVDNM